MRRFLLLILCVALISAVSAADTLRVHSHIRWYSANIPSTGSIHGNARLSFDGAQYSLENPYLAYYNVDIKLAENVEVLSVILDNEVYGIMDPDFYYEGLAELTQQIIHPQWNISYDRKVPVLITTFIPVRVNSYNGLFEKLESFDLIVVVQECAPNRESDDFIYADHSVLAGGNWYKISTAKDGVHRIGYSDLQSFGIDPGSIDPRNIRLYGNGGGMMAESLTDSRPDDLYENAIFISGEADGSFDPDDYILFYGQSPHQWYYESLKGHFNHRQNIYSETTVYFLTADLGPGRRITSNPSVTDPATVQVSSFTDFAYHERDLFNLINAGRVWYGEVFDIKTTFDTTFSFPDILTGEPAYFRVYVAAKASFNSIFKFYDGSTQIYACSVEDVNGDTYAEDFLGDNDFFPSSSSLAIKVSYQKPESSATGWLNYFELNVARKLNFTGPQMGFRAPQAIGEGSVAEFTFSNASSSVEIWEVTKPWDARQQQSVQNGNNQAFRVRHDTLRQFIAFDGTFYLTAHFIGKVDNQDLHAMKVPEMVIISHENFWTQAEQLADLHRQMDGMDVAVVDIRQVYNEFSSGAQDITALRNFIKMLYDRSGETGSLKYLLLFGDASFDYKDRIPGNSNYVPTWEAEESLTIVTSIASDDYYGFLSGIGDNQLDIGIGRLPVENSEQASQTVEKIIHYATNTPTVMRDWRNVVTFVADDEDANMHLDQAEDLATFLDTNYSAYNIDKIYVDAFPQYSTSGGQRTPDVNKAINNRINKGTLIMNYTGHGGEVGWGHERFLEISDIDSWKNHEMLPIFITATCEFSRYDDPERVSAGELVFRNPIGGAVALFTTARATFGGSNFNLNKALFEVMFEKDQGEYYRFGDLIRISKNKGGVVDNDRKFVLLGDPALRLAYPVHQVTVTKVNGRDANQEPDTLRALSTVEIQGEVTDESGNTLTGFDGTLYSIVFDKPSHITTLETDETSRPAIFGLQNNILYKGKAQVENGEFSFSFIVPKDIAYQYGFGKISFYAATEDIDANGFYMNLVIGGVNPDAEPDSEGPEIELYMNNELFVFGGITDENPVLLANISDESGINTVGSGIGHDIVAILDGNTDKPFILNEYYEAGLNSFTNGSVRYQFLGLDPGLHSVKLKVWDVFNNSSEAYLEFYVNPEEDFIITDLMNYPNPFREGTNIIFEHNQPEAEFDVTIRIFNLAGQMLKIIEEKMAPSGYRSEPVFWDGRDEGGYSVAKGVYIYRVSVRRPDGNTQEDSAKLIKFD
jgi:hypothetical protein